MKRALKSSGANVTDQHILDVSMCALFLLQAAKKCDTVFKVFKKPTAHTVRDAAKDISKLLKMLLDKKITTENSGCKELDCEWCKYTYQRRMAREAAHIKGGR